MLDALKDQVYHLHLQLFKYQLVVWTGGNVSARDPGSDLVVIKPSGVLYDVLRPEDHVVVNLEIKVDADLFGKGIGKRDETYFDRDLQVL